MVAAPPNSSTTLLARLRSETRPYHDALERNRFNQQLSAGTPSAEATAHFLAKLYGFLEPYETRLQQHAFGPEWEISRRLRAALILQDLGQPAPPLCLDLPPLHSEAQLLGAMYVLEGSTLGGQVISRQLAKAAIPLRIYFSGAGDQTGPLWQRFCHLLTAAATPATEAAIIASASLTFQKLHAWINQPER